MAQLVVVTGGAGFVGTHLVRALAATGLYHVRAVDIVEPQFECHAHEFCHEDLRDPEAALRACRGADIVFALAADMGGIGYIHGHDSAILLNNLAIDTNTCTAAKARGVQRLIYTSSACVYPAYLQDGAPRQLVETQVYPAAPDGNYGWEKLTAERLCSAYAAEKIFEARVARLHNVFGPLGAWDGGREKAPAALCRKVATAKLKQDAAIDIWGDGLQRRSYCYVDDCVRALILLMRSEYEGPLNIGQDRDVSVRELVGIISSIAGIDVSVRCVSGARGVASRNADISAARQHLGWSPTVSLEEGLKRTYHWIEQQVEASHRLESLA